MALSALEAKDALVATGLVLIAALPITLIWVLSRPRTTLSILGIVFGQPLAILFVFSAAQNVCPYDSVCSSEAEFAWAYMLILLSLLISFLWVVIKFAFGRDDNSHLK